jgi:hypothetical protein
VNGGIGFAFKVDEFSRALVEFRGTDVFLDQQVIFGSINVGALFLF